MTVSPSIQWICKPFAGLEPQELYACLRLRSEVFVVEQRCVFLDMDNKDAHAHHLMGILETRLVAYARIFGPGIYYRESSIGRIVTSPAVRRKGIGRALLQQSIETAYILHGKGVIRIGAQLYLKAFYASFGFRQAGEIYLEDGIEHIEMLLFSES